MNTERILQAKNNIDEYKKNVAVSSGELKAILESLKNDFELTSLDEVNDRLKRIRDQKEELNSEIDKELTKIERELGKQ